METGHSTRFLLAMVAAVVAVSAAIGVVVAVRATSESHPHPRADAKLAPTTYYLATDYQRVWFIEWRVRGTSVSGTARDLYPYTRIDDRTHTLAGFVRGQEVEVRLDSGPPIYGTYRPHETVIVHGKKYPVAFTLFMTLNQQNAQGTFGFREASRRDFANAAAEIGRAP